MSTVVGIDLGTTNTVVAAVRAGRATSLATETGKRLIPSIVSFHPNGSVLVGNEAKARRLQDSPNTIYSTKRLIGRSFDSPEVKRARSRSAFQIQEGPGHGVLVVARSESYTLSEISAFVLKKAKSVAEAALGDTVERAVVTVPANFNDLQRSATKVAGHIAGIEVLRILNEPTAAALAYGYGKGNQERIVVYDFGGGTFDVTLLDLAGNVFEVLATSGDTFLGGDDIDLVIAERMAERYLKTHRYDPRADRQVFERLLGAAEELKIKLTNMDVATVQLQELAFGPGGRALDMPFSMTRQELDEIALPFVDRTIRVCQEAMAAARLKPNDFSQVIVVGGASRLATVRRRVAECFGRPALEKLSADEVVALGAAIQASALAGSERKKGRTLSLGSAPSTPGPVPMPSMDMNDDDNPTAVRRLPVGLPPHPPPSPTRGKLQSNPDEPTLAQTPKKGTTAPGLFPLPSDKPASPWGQVDEEPWELHSATKALRELEQDHQDKVQSRPAPPVQPVGKPGVTTARMPSAPPPRQPVGIPGVTTARMPSAPPPRQPLGMPGITTARMPSAPPLEPARPLSPSMEIAEGIAAGIAAGTVAGTPPPLAPSPTIAMSPEPVAPMAPLLIDVTPLSLSVETVGDYCDVIIDRNTPIPCERTRLFATAADNQSAVTVAIAQGESNRFSENVLLGQLDLTGLRTAPRGEVQVAVTFELDTNGILNVRASDRSTGKQAQATIRLEAGVPKTSDVEAMQGRINRMT